MLTLDLIIDTTEATKKIIQDETESNLGFRVLLLPRDREKIANQCIHPSPFGKEVLHLY